METNKRILIVEDEHDIAHAFEKQLLMAGGFDVDIANGGKRGLEMLKENLYDVVLLDLVMPDIDGLEVLKIVKENPDIYKSKTIVVLTNVTSNDARKEAEDLGATNFVIKTDADIEQVLEDIV